MFARLGPHLILADDQLGTPQDEQPIHSRIPHHRARLDDQRPLARPTTEPMFELIDPFSPGPKSGISMTGKRCLKPISNWQTASLVASIHRARLAKLASETI